MRKHKQSIWINDLTVEESETIKALIEKLRKQRSYADRPTLYHDALMVGIKSLALKTDLEQ